MKKLYPTYMDEVDAELATATPEELRAITKKLAKK
jgi:hypothetical protein